MFVIHKMQKRGTLQLNSLLLKQQETEVNQGLCAKNLRSGILHFIVTTLFFAPPGTLEGILREKETEVK